MQIIFSYFVFYFVTDCGTIVLTTLPTETVSCTNRNSILWMYTNLSNGINIVYSRLLVTNSGN